jgi:hypothetical protein
MVWVKGRRRVPTPAVGMMAFMRNPLDALVIINYELSKINDE